VVVVSGGGGGKKTSSMASQPASRARWKAPREFSGKWLWLLSPLCAITSIFQERERREKAGGRQEKEEKEEKEVNNLGWGFIRIRHTTERKRDNTKETSRGTPRPFTRCKAQGDKREHK